MEIRAYNANDCDAVSTLFYETIHSVNAKDYSDKQLFAWASSREDLKNRRDKDLLEQYTLVACCDGKIVGFASIDKSGELDLLFVDKDYQGQGIANALCDELEKDFSVVTTYASITAKSFFEKRGYVVTKEQEARRSGIKLKNFEMKKSRKVSSGKK